MAYIYKTYSSSGTNNQRKFTASVWVKRCATGVQHEIASAYKASNGFQTDLLKFNSDDTLRFYSHSDSGQGATSFITNAKFRDTSAWYHIVLNVDSTNSTSTERFKMWVNGEQITSWSTATYPPLNNYFIWGMPTDAVHQIGALNGSHTFNGLMSHFHYVQNANHAPTVFGETDSTTGEWKIKTEPTGITYSDQSFWFFKNDNLATDRSGNGNNWSTSGTLTKTEDNPSNVFCTNNPLWKQQSSRYLTHTLGNTMISGGGSATWYQTPGTLAFNSGKFYWECKWNAGTNLTQNHAGVIDYDKTMEDGLFRSKTGSVFFTNEDGGEMHIDGPATSADYGTIAQNDILGVAVDMDATTPTVKFYKNGSLHASTNAASLAGKFVTPAQMIYQSGEFQLNFGNGTFGSTQLTGTTYQATGLGIFKYQPPTGYTALSTKGLNL